MSSVKKTSPLFVRKLSGKISPLLRFCLAPAVVVNPVVGLDVIHDQFFIECLQLLYPAPGSEGNEGFHIGIGGRDDELRISLHNGFNLLNEISTILTAILDDDPSILKVMNLEGPWEGHPVNTPRGDEREMRSRRGWVAVIGEGDPCLSFRDVSMALADQKSPKGLP